MPQQRALAYLADSGEHHNRSLRDTRGDQLRKLRAFYPGIHSLTQAATAKFFDAGERLHTIRKV